MKATRIYTLLALLLMAGGVKTQAQEYVPMIQEGNEWYTLDAQVCSSQTLRGYNTLVHRIADDTLIGGVRYTKVMQTVNDVGTPTLAALLREEDSKVWETYNGNSEILLYDFTANVGDTLRYGEFEESMVVDSISIENIGGVDRKKFWFGLEHDWFWGPYALETWIEGIGSDMGLLYSGWFDVTGGYTRALCFHQNGELIWQNPEYDACVITSVEEINDKVISVYPNPAMEIVTIDGVEAAEVQVYNGLGQTVKTVQGSNEINVSGLPAGIYSIRVTMNDGNLFLNKIIKL
jgi:hypothetical protein